MTFPLTKRLAAECLGTGLLVATVVGSGIMAEKLAGGNVALALLGNTLPTGAILVVLIGIHLPFRDGSHPRRFRAELQEQFVGAWGGGDDPGQWRQRRVGTLGGRFGGCRC